MERNGNAQNKQTISIYEKHIIENLKKYFRHSGYPGGLKAETLKELRNRKPQDLIKHAVSGMLPQNKLKAKMLKRLYVFPDKEHNYKDKFIK